LQAERASFPSPGNTASDHRRPSPDRRVLHRANALKEAAEDTRPCERDKAIAEKPISRGHTPSTLDLGPELAAGTDGRDGKRAGSNLPTSAEPAADSAPWKQKPTTHRPPQATSRRRRTPEQGLHKGRLTSTGSPPAPERSTNGARKSPRGLIPPRRHRHRLDDAAGNRNPNPST